MLAGEPVTILLVEDDMGHAEIVRRSLERFCVMNCFMHLEDGQAALDYLFRHNGFADTAAYPMPNIILLDLRLPKVNGLEVLRRIKEDKKLRMTPVVVLTTSDVNADRVKAYEYGVNSYLVKALDFEKFSQMLETFVTYWLSCNRFPDTEGE